MENRNWHDRNYKKLLLLPLVLLLFSIGYLIYFNSTTGDFVKKDISLTGGTSITVYDKIDVLDLQNSLADKLPDLNVREIYEITTGEQKAVIIETTLDGDSAKNIVEEYVGYSLVEGENSDFEFTGSILSEAFYKQLLLAILIAFAFMAIVVFILFKTVVPSTAVIISAFADILMTLVTFNLFGMKMSTAGIVAFLMLIGYSVDTDILLTTRMLKRSEGSLNSRIFGSMKTGMTMTLTSFFAFLVALFVVRSFSIVLTQIFTILVIGLAFDLLNTWVTNVSILKWYVEAKK
ncbi:protein translocase subunit SecF [archaeon]|nr:protein translocase subunit SecF [archaeon]